MSFLATYHEHLEAIEADLVAVGWTWDDVPERLPWRSLFAFVKHLPATSALGRALDPETASWMDGTLVANLLAELGYRLDVANWQRSRDGQKGHRKPKPWPRPWVKAQGTRTIGRGAIPMSAWADFWGDGS